MIKEWLLAKILKNRVVFFKDKNDEFLLVNDIYFDDEANVVILTYENRRIDDGDMK